MVRFTLAVALVLAACTGDSPTPAADAPPAGTFGAPCTTVSDMSTECASHVCTNSIDQAGTPICSQKCTMLMATDPTCPAGPSNMKCNSKGYCKP
ncbi:MAG TPA: hypothetical protein VL326_38060 [Kofleriaceae bacterium]|nr:hypothetical protein [Kofleriaceae bacterium]